MLTCKEANYLASKKLDQQLPRSERFGLWLHIFMCRLCRRYTKDIQILHRLILMAGSQGQVVLPDTVKLSAQSRDRIKQALEQALKQSE